MANEIHFIGPAAGLSQIAKVYRPSTKLYIEENIALAANPEGSIHYWGDCASLQAGDIVERYLTSGGFVDAYIYETLSDDALLLAAKILKNKRTQNKTTGVITVYDDDGVTEILFFTPTEDAETIIVTPSVPE